ncbi:hypothetical protein LPB73_07695 [Tardiphaga sp. 37S4]|uniref:hypothetical protein n=1 Tax=Tardiphaga sp. 37S4 TaxID=1404741 RepID=UPI001E5A0EC7|nr:hypothetical protein [Tardiphaga sp. 37S4]UFS77251.1 hypothetical protein LPB73_07695 [Tardiphaga sp. 37S4]
MTIAIIEWRTIMRHIQVWLREVDGGTNNACWVVCLRGDPGAVCFTGDAPPVPKKPKSDQPRRRDDWHYDSQGYCDNPGRGY